MRRIILLSSLLLSQIPALLQAQNCQPLSGYTQNFNSLPASGTGNAFVNGTTLPGWHASRSGTLAINAGDGGSNTGALYSFGTGSASDRAIGSIGSGGTNAVNYAVCLTNNTGATVNSFTLAYTGEQWRNGGGTGLAQTATFSYRIGGTDLATTGYVNDVALNFTSPVFSATATALDGNATANRVAISSTLSGFTLQAGEVIWLRWTDLDHASNDHGLAIDDLSITVAGPPAVSVSINDVSITEGNAGTTTATVTVSLTGTPSGSVTGNYATADNTATTANLDYVAVSGSFTLTAASPSATINVTINGDLNVEPTETLFVNLTSVVGAALADGQGQITIQNDDAANCGTPKISAIQGSGATTPLSSSDTLSPEGIVTNIKPNGFFLQEEEIDYDANPATSEGIFVFTSTAPTVSIGDRVCVTGRPAEFRTLTQLNNVTSIAVISSGNPLPSPVALSLSNPSPAGTTVQLERYEGMRLSGTFRAVSGSDTQFGGAPTNSFFYVWVEGQAIPYREPGIRAPLGIPVGSLKTIPPVPQFDGNPEALGVDTRQNNLAISGGQLVSNVIGTLDAFDTVYTLYQQTGVIPAVTGSLPRVDATGATAGQIAVASANLEFYTAGKQAKAAAYIADILKYPAVVAVQETGSGSLSGLATAISVGGRTYTSYQASTGGTQRVGFLVDTSRVKVVTPPYDILAAETFLDPSSLTNLTLHDRAPFVLEARAKTTGGSDFPFTIINVHLRSLIEIESDLPEGATTQGNDTRTKRLEAAKSIANYVQNRQTTTPAERIMITGDFNAFQFNDGYVDVLGILKGDEVPADQVVLHGNVNVNPDLTNLVDTIPAAQRFFYVFGGSRQVLDNMLVTANLLPSIAKFEFAHGNTEFADIFSTNNAVPERTADHDNPVAYVTLPNVAPTVSAQTVIVSATAATSFTLTATEPDSQPLSFSTVNVPAKGSVGFTNATSQATYTPNANTSGGDTFTYAASDGGLSTNGVVKLLQDVSGTARVSLGGALRDSTGNYRATVRVTNTGAVALSGPLHLYFTSLPAGVNVISPSGTFNGNSYLTFSSSIAPGATVSFVANFSGPLATRPVMQVLSGTF